MPNRNGIDDIDPGRRDHLARNCITPSQRRQHGARDDAEQNRDVGDKALETANMPDDHQQHEERNAKSFELTISGIGKRALHAVNHLGQQPAHRRPPN